MNRGGRAVVRGDSAASESLFRTDDARSSAEADTASMSSAALAADPQAAVEAAAARAGVDVRELVDLQEIQQASQLFDAVWPDPTQTIMPVNLVRALSAAGSYVAGAYLGQELAGAIVGFVGLHDEAVVVHSHILGVLPQARGRSVGHALKLHQRAWCLERDVDIVMWTFDPLVRRNAYFNLCKLGAVGGRYEPNFYGAMNDGINSGDETDRMVAMWRLRSDRVVDALSGSAPPAADGEAAVLLDIDTDGGPKVLDGKGDVLRCRIPEDILALRAGPAALSKRWRTALRDTLGNAIRDGFEATGMDRQGWYTLTRRSD